MANHGSSSTGPPMYKNKLQQYTQKNCLPLPAYRTSNEGFPHAPKFRSSVLVDGLEYTSKLTFRKLKDAEQDAAKLAFECIMSNSKQQLVTKTLLDQDQKSSKSKLHEMAFKKMLEIPKYTTELISESEGSLPLFVSTVMVGTQKFTGNGAQNRKDAEQFAAHIALQSLHGSIGEEREKEFCNTPTITDVGTDSRDILENQIKVWKKRGCDTRGKTGFTDVNHRELATNPRDHQASKASVPLPQQRGFKRKHDMTLRSFK